ncbi:hypothetical protein OLQ22_08225 [Campylobacter jejuni]|nr:hypothetical protein [Campylobacter jejuni]
MFLDSFGNVYNDGFVSYNNPIKSFIESRKITKLVHFTNGKNIKSIDKYGILSVAELQKRGWFYSKNDEMRLDGLLDFISLSITDINHFVFDKFVNNGSLKDPHIVIISPRILWESNNKRLYCIANAATKSPRGGTLKDLKAFFI